MASAPDLTDIDVAIQLLLKKDNHYDGPIDGTLGPKTYAAIRKLLTSYKINHSGWNDARLKRAAEQALYRSEDIEVGSIDGLEGPSTRNARAVYNAKLTLNWRDKMDDLHEEIDENKTDFEPVDYYKKVYDAVLAAAKKRMTFFLTSKIKYPEVIAHLGATQSSLETGYGKSVKGNNIFGIKGNGPAGSTTVPTVEEINGKKVTITDKFRVYHNWVEAAADYVDVLLKGERYAKIFDANTVEDAIEIQGKTGYSTWSSYGPDCLKIYQKLGKGIELPEYKGAEKVVGSPAVVEAVKVSKLVWPRQKDCMSFYGRPGTNQVRLNLPYQMRIAWDLDQKITSFQCHQKVAVPMRRIFQRTLEHYGYEEIKRLRLDLWGGTLNVRKMRGGSSWSMHSWGIAVDIDPDRNALRSTSKSASLARPEYKKFWEFVYDEGAISLGIERNYDWMHWQFARL
jgi:hypothetical protein